MSCVYSKGVFLCQTDIVGVVAVLTAAALALVLVYMVGRHGAPWS